MLCHCASGLAQSCAEDWAGCFICSWAECWGPWGILPARRQQALSSCILLLSAGSPWVNASTGQVSCKQRGCFTPGGAAQRLSNGPGTGGEMEEEMGTLLGCTPLGDAVSNGGVLGTAGSLEGMGWTRHLMFSDLPLLDQPSKGLRTQRGFAEACCGTTCQPGS